MQHCTKHHRHNPQYFRGQPPSLSTQPKQWFSHADKNNIRSISQQDIITTLCAHLRPNSQYQHNFIVKKVCDICKICEVYSYSRINLDSFLNLKMDKRLIQAQYDYEKMFRSHRIAEHDHHHNHTHHESRVDSKNSRSGNRGNVRTTQMVSCNAIDLNR